MLEHRRSPRRLERYPVYVLNVTIPPEDVDALYEPRKKLLGYKVRAWIRVDQQADGRMLMPSWSCF